ncbi:MAG: hypothetical protein RIB65_06550 [Ilumatobacter fluminis]|uniref:hypothetical protein n=1 Tax=Ilumatobacter fluminis TaxID=467091 RepID=UPI0032EB098B
MSNIDPPVTGSLEGNEATQFDGPDTIGTDGGSGFERDPFSGLDNDGDGDPEIDAPVQTWEDIQAREQGRHEVRAEEIAEAQAAREAEEAEAAARAEAAANGDPYYLGSDTHDGEPVDIYLMPDGATYMVNADGEVVAVAFPEDPVYVGQVYSDDGALEVFELYNGEQVVVADGELVGTLDEVDHSTFTVGGPMAVGMGLPPDTEAFEAYTVPMGPPTYDTQVVNAETGEVVYELNTGNVAPFQPEGEALATYDPPGADYTMWIDDGEVINVVPNPEEPEWSLLGIIEYYEDGTVSVDLAIVEVDVDLIGPEKGISASVDLVFIEVGAGVDWDSDGNWSFEADAEIDLGFAEAGGSLDVEWEDGEFSADVDAFVEMQLGLVTVQGEGSLGIDIGSDGVEITADGEVTLNAFGAYVGAAGEAAIAVGPGGFEMSGEAGFVGGHDWVGDWGLHVGGDFRTDGTAGGTGAGVELGGTMETPDSGPLADPWSSSMEIGVRADTDEGVGTYGEYHHEERTEPESQLDLGWHDDMGVGDEIETPDDASVDESDDVRRRDLDDETRMREHRLGDDDTADETTADLPGRVSEETTRTSDLPTHASDETTTGDFPGRVSEGTARPGRDVSGDHPTRPDTAPTDPFDDIVTSTDRMVDASADSTADRTFDEPAVVFEGNDEPLATDHRIRPDEPTHDGTADADRAEPLREAEPVRDLAAEQPSPTDEPLDHPIRPDDRAIDEGNGEPLRDEPVHDPATERPALTDDLLDDPITRTPTPAPEPETDPALAQPTRNGIEPVEPAATPAPTPEPGPAPEHPARAEGAEPVAPAAAPLPEPTPVVEPAPEPLPDPAPVVEAAPEPMSEPIPGPQIEVEAPAPLPEPEPLPIDEPMTDDLLD